MKITKHILYMGLNDKDSRQQEINTVDAFKMATRAVCRYYDGATIKDATGIYRYESGEIEVEKSLEIAILFADDDKIAKLVADLKILFNQESIALQKMVIESDLV